MSTTAKKKKSLYVVHYHHRDTGETVYRTCDSRQSAFDWAEWSKKQPWVEPSTVLVTMQQGGIKP